VSEARLSLSYELGGRYSDFYNRRRPLSILGAQTPERAYLDHMPGQIAASGCRRYCSVTPPALGDATASAQRAYQPVGEPKFRTETL